MINKRFPFIHKAKLVLECATPLSIKSDNADPTFDNRLMCDANGLPTIPGTSIAGVLRSLYTRAFGGDEADYLFGFTNGNDSQISLVNVEFAQIHDCKNNPISGLVGDSDIANDHLLNKLQDDHPLVRDQVKLTHRGVAKQGGKMDVTLVPVGTRFSVELELSSEDENSTQQWQNLVSLFSRPDFRLGGLTRRGLGAMKIIDLKTVSLNLQESDDRQRWLNGANYQPSVDITLDKSHSDFISLNLLLQAEDFWRIGSGHNPIGQYPKEPKLTPKTEWRVIWNNNNQAEIKRQEDAIVIPATSIKGALSHRLAFHYNCQARQFVEDDLAQVETDNLAVKTLFGLEKNGVNGEGHAGFVILNDIYVREPDTNKRQVIMHNAIDRFTGGTIDGALYGEELLWQTKIPLELYLDTKGLSNYLNQANLSETECLNIQTALQKTLEDLIQGRIAIGAGSNRGHGFLKVVDKDVQLENLLIGAVA